LIPLFDLRVIDRLGLADRWVRLRVWVINIEPKLALREKKLIL
jgi:hypothetical protein